MQKSDHFSLRQPARFAVILDMERVGKRKFRACLKFVFEVENGQIWVLAKRFLSCIRQLADGAKKRQSEVS